MAWLDDFDEEQVVNVKISALGAITGFDSGGQPEYAASTIKYDDDAAVWQLNATEVLANDKINNPSTHSIVLDPEKVTGTLIDSDSCEITLNGVLTQFKMYTPNDILGMGEVLQFTAIRKVVT